MSEQEIFDGVQEIFRDVYKRQAETILPTPMLISFTAVSPFLFDVLNLFADLLDLRLHLNDKSGHGEILRFGTDGIGLPVELLEMCIRDRTEPCRSIISGLTNSRN